MKMLNTSVGVFRRQVLSLLRHKCYAPMKTDGELKLMRVLKDKFPAATDVDVSDISGGCGSMYDIFIESVDFKGQRTMKQHKMVNEALKEEMKEIHGLRIKTKVPDLS